MELYERLAPHYDELFPQNPKATSFLLDLANLAREAKAAQAGPRPLVVDFGCATGSQALDLARAGWRAVGWEPCAAMLEIARRKARELGLGASFEPYAMQDAARLEPGSVDLALCLGNTLPHLGGEAELDRFIADLASILAPGGAVVFQLLNYELVLRLLREGDFAFPVLNAEGAAFERSYSMESDGRILFRTELESEGRRYSESGRLYPFARASIASALTATGFERNESRSAWDVPAFDPAADRYLILSARRS